MLQFSATPDKFTRLPDVRFSFEGDVDDLKKSVLAAQKGFTDDGAQPTPVEIEVDQFPSYRLVIEFALCCIISVECSFGCLSVYRAVFLICALLVRSEICWVSISTLFMSRETDEHSGVSLWVFPMHCRIDDRCYSDS